MTQRIKLSEAASELPSVTTRTLIRWIVEGVNGVRLGGVKVGGRWYTTTDEIETFVQATTKAACKGERPQQTRNAAAMQAVADLQRSYGREKNQKA